MEVGDEVWLETSHQPSVRGPLRRDVMLSEFDCFRTIKRCWPLKRSGWPVGVNRLCEQSIKFLVMMSAAAKA